VIAKQSREGWFQSRILARLLSGTTPAPIMRWVTPPYSGGEPHAPEPFYLFLRGIRSRGLGFRGGMFAMLFNRASRHQSQWQCRTQGNEQSADRSETNPVKHDERDVSTTISVGLWSERAGTFEV